MGHVKHVWVLQEYLFTAIFHSITRLIKIKNIDQLIKNNKHMYFCAFL